MHDVACEIACAVGCAETISANVLKGEVTEPTTVNWPRISCRQTLVAFFLYFDTGPSSFEALDITHYCLDLLKILHQAASLSERVTAIKLVDAWCGKGQTSLRMRDVKTPDLSREDCERVVVYLLLEGVLREDFHFTPYSTISYLVPGPNAKLVQKFGKRVSMDFRVDSSSKKVG